LKRVMGVLISTQIITPSAFVAAEGDSDEAGVDEEVVRPAPRDADETERSVDAESLTPPVGRREATEAARDAESSASEVQRTSGTGPQMNRNPHSNRRLLTDVPEAAPGKTSRRSQKLP